MIKLYKKNNPNGSLEENIKNILGMIPSNSKTEEEQIKKINENINIIREKYSDECLTNLSIITKKICELSDSSDIEYPALDIKIEEVIKMVLNYYKNFSSKDYLILQEKMKVSGNEILDWNMLKTIQGDKTYNVYPAIVHQFRHIIENDYRSPSYNVLSNTLAIFNEIDCIDYISKSNSEFNVLKNKRIKTLEDISLFMNTYIQILMDNKEVDKKTIEKHFKIGPSLPKEYKKIIQKMYDLSTFELDIKNIISTLKAIDLSTQFNTADSGEVKLELDTISKTLRGEEMNVNNKKLNGIGATIDCLIDNMENYEYYVESLKLKKSSKVK